MIADLIPFGGRFYWAFLAMLVFARGADFLSTWVATPNLVLEGNPIAKWLGWKLGIVVNVVLCLVFAVWPLSAIAIATTSCLVAARNFQSAWLMRTLGEENYRDWYVERLQQARLPIYLFCLSGHILLTGGVGLALMFFYGGSLIPFAIGVGIVAYAAAVAVYTLLSVWRIRRVVS
jgi:hypothetical protein